MCACTMLCFLCAMSYRVYTYCICIYMRYVVSSCVFIGVCIKHRIICVFVLYFFQFDSSKYVYVYVNMRCHIMCVYVCIIMCLWDVKYLLPEFINLSHQKKYFQDIFENML